MCVSFIEIVLLIFFLNIKPIKSSYCFLTRLAPSLFSTNSPKISIVAEKPLEFKSSTISKTSSVLSPATYGLAKGFAAHFGRCDIVEDIIELNKDI